MYFKHLHVRDLKAELKRRALDVSGTKTVLAERLKASMEERGENPDTFEFADVDVFSEAVLTAQGVGVVTTIVSSQPDGATSGSVTAEGGGLLESEVALRCTSAEMEQRIGRIEVILSKLEGCGRRNVTEVPVFDGSSSWSIYKIQFDAAVRFNGFDEQRSALSLVSALRGNAAEVLQLVGAGGSIALGDLVGALELRFGNAHLRQVHSLALSSRRQRRDETLQQLYIDICRLARLAHPEAVDAALEGLIVDAFTSSIQNRETQVAVRMCGKITSQDVLLHALTFEAARTCASGLSVCEIRSPLESTDYGHAGVVAWKGQVRLGTVSGGPTKIRCWKCSRLGHLRSHCRAMEAETVSGESGPGRTVVGEQIVFPVCSISRVGNSLMVDGSVGNRCCSFTLDTGATRSIVRPEMVADVSREEFSNTGCSLRTATGEIVPVLGEVDLLVRFGASDRSILHRFLVAGITDSCILGLDFMVANGMVIDAGNRQVICGGLKLSLRMKTIDALRRVDVGSVGNGSGAEGHGSVRAEPQHGFRGLDSMSGGNSLAKAVPVPRSQTIAEILGFRERNVTLTDKEVNLAAGLLEEFRDAFAVNDEDCGRTDLVQHRINTGDTIPIRQRPRRLPLAKREEVYGLIQDMGRNGTIEPSTGPWSSPVVLVGKKDGGTRFCVDYRQLNNVTKKDSYPLPRIDDTLDTLAGSVMFSTLDLKSGYWQVAMHPDDKEKTAFSVGNGLWQFTVMPFGLCNAPATFERLMEQVLLGLNGKTCLVYLDDIIVLGRSFEDHLENLKGVLKRLRDAGLKLGPKKCTFFVKSVKYLGHIVAEDGVRPDPGKVEAVKSWPEPKDKRALRSFLGLCTYYRRFVLNFSGVARCLHRLTEKEVDFVWTQEHADTFSRLKELICSVPVLAYPVPGCPFILDTDASGLGVGGVLSQVVDGEERVLSYYSKVLSKAETNYCVTRRELLAVVSCVKSFHKYLYGQEFLLRTDHAALTWLLQFRDPEGQTARWIERLQSYNFRIEHRKGAAHGNADALSRRPCPLECRQCAGHEGKECVQAIVMEVPAEWSDAAVRKDQLEDADIGPVLSAVELGVRPTRAEVAGTSEVAKCYFAQWDSLFVENGVLSRRWESNDGRTSIRQLVLPRKRVVEVVSAMHGSGHFGVNKTLERARERFYWVHCGADVKEVCRKCDICSAKRGPPTRSRGPMMQHNSGSPFERIGIDITGPFTMTNGGNRVMLVVMDYFTKWPEVIALPNQEAETVAKALVQHWICRFGVPLEIHSDQGRNFESHLFKDLCRLMGMVKTRTTPMHPQSDGMVERFNRTLLEGLAKVILAHQRDWDEQIPLFLLAYRTAQHDSIKCAPAEVLFGRQLKLPIDLEYGSPPQQDEEIHDYVGGLRAKLREIHDTVRTQIFKSSNRMKSRYDLKVNSAGFSENDFVWLYNPKRVKGKSPKLQSDWEGPFKVIKKLNDVVYRIQKNAKAKMKVVHIDRMAIYNGGDPRGEHRN